MANQEFLGIDVRLVDGDVQFDNSNDLSLVKYEDNIIQAVLNRLKTRRGWYERNPDYGSFVVLATGEKNKVLLENSVRSSIREALLQDPRIESVQKVIVRAELDKLDVSITVKLIKENGLLNIVFPIDLKVVFGG